MYRFKYLKILCLLVVLLFIAVSPYAAAKNQVSISDGSLLIEACRNQFSLLVFSDGFTKGYNQAVAEMKIKEGNGVAWGAPGIYLYWAPDEWIGLRLYEDSYYVIEGYIDGKWTRYRGPSLKSIGSWGEPAEEGAWTTPNRMDWNILRLILTPDSVRFYASMEGEELKLLAITPRASRTQEEPWLVIGKGYSAGKGKPFLANSHTAPGAMGNTYIDDVKIEVDGRTLLYDDFQRGEVGDKWVKLVDGDEDLDSKIEKLQEIGHDPLDFEVREPQEVPMNIPLLQAVRLSKTHKRVDESYSDRWTTIPEASGIVVDGKLNDAPWKRTPDISDFVTIYDALPAKEGTEAHLAYDDDNLYIAIKCHYIGSSSPFSSDKVEILMSPFPSGWDYRHISLSSYGGVVELSGNQLGEYESRIFHGDGFWSVEMAIPFASLGWEGPDLGDLWRFNIIRGRTQISPISSWIPIREAYVEPESSGRIFVKEGRFGQIYFGEGPLMEADSVRLEYCGYTEKEFILKGKGQLDGGNFQIIWRSPSGAQRSIEPSKVTLEGDEVHIFFVHPAPFEKGIYTLDIEGMLRLTFDDESLVRAGVASQAELVAKARPQPSTLKTIKVKPVQEVQDLLDIIPTKSGVWFCNSPARPHLRQTNGRSPNQLFQWDIKDPYGMRCVNSKTRFPDEEYKSNGVIKLVNPLGEVVEYPYYRSSDGTRYFLEPHIWYLQREYMVGKVEELAKSDPGTSARLLYHFAQVYPGYVPVYDRPEGVAPIEDVGPPYTTQSGVWTRWFYMDLGEVAKLANAFAEIRKTDAFHQLSQEIGQDVEKIIEYGLIRPSVEYIRTYPPTSHNMNPYLWKGLAQIGRALGEPDYIHDVVERVKSFMESEFRFDGFQREITISYHNQVISGLAETIRILKGWTDPEGYISPRDGKRFENLDLSQEVAIYKEASGVSQKLVYPDGKYLPIQDTWASSSGGAVLSSAPALFPASGIGKLGMGNGKDQIQAYLTFAPKSGAHIHMDPLNLTLFGAGRELLPDLGYSLTKYHRWTVSTLGHNTVVVNGKDMSYGEDEGAGNLHIFAPISQEIQVLRASQEAAYKDIVDEYGREVWLIGLPSGGGYLVDIFRVSGGTRHEYTLHGDTNNTTEITTKLPLEEYGPYLLPEGTHVVEPSSERDGGSAGGHYYAYAFIRDVKRAKVPHGKYQLTLEGREMGKRADLHITGFIEPGEAELFIGRSPSLRGTRETNQDTNDLADKYWMPKMVLRREGRDLRSTFVTVMEPGSPGLFKKGPRIANVELLTLDGGKDGDVALVITYGKIRDIILSTSNPQEPMVVDDMELHGKLGFIRLENEKVTRMYLIGGTLLKKGNEELVSQGPIKGGVIGILRKVRGDEYDALITDIEVPKTLEGRYVIVTHPQGYTPEFSLYRDSLPVKGQLNVEAGATHGYRIKEIRKEGTGSVLILDMDPGFNINQDGTSALEYFPFTTWDGEHTFTIDNVDTKE
jgi:hypothetical protein